MTWFPEATEDKYFAYFWPILDKSLRKAQYRGFSQRMMGPCCCGQGTFSNFLSIKLKVGQLLVSSIKGEVKEKHISCGWTFPCFPAHLMERRSVLTRRAMDSGHSDPVIRVLQHFSICPHKVF